MAESLNQGALVAMAAALLLSLLTVFVLLQRRVDGKTVLAYEPRRSVPWGAVAGALPVLFLALSFLSTLGTESQEIASEEFIASGWANVATMLGFVAVAMALLAVGVDADALDLGLPASVRQFARDVGIGTIACIASLTPVYVVQYVLFMVVQPEDQHQLIEQLLEHRSPQMMLVGVAMAVVAAPIFEEFAFRVLLQGWLERAEDEKVGHQRSRRSPVEPVEKPADPDLDPEAHEPTISYTHPPTDGEPVATATPEAGGSAQPKQGMIAGVPHGWTPILISSCAFGLAHYGHGVAPVPLIVFGIVLGYLYQRTHRLAPSVAAHMLFNAYSLSLLWLQIR